MHRQNKIKKLWRFLIFVFPLNLRKKPIATAYLTAMIWNLCVLLEQTSSAVVWKLNIGKIHGLLVNFSSFGEKISHGSHSKLFKN